MAKGVNKRVKRKEENIFKIYLLHFSRNEAKTM